MIRTTSSPDDGRGGESVVVKKEVISSENEEESDMEDLETIIRDCEVKLEEMEGEDPLSHHHGGTSTPSALEVEDNHNCLLCNKLLKKNLTPALTNNVAEANYHAMFILLKMLQLPRKLLITHLVNVGSPGDWIAFCSKCMVLVDGALECQKKISQLEEKLRKTQLEMMLKVKISYDNEKNTSTSKLSSSKVRKATKEIRKFVHSRHSVSTYDDEVALPQRIASKRQFSKTLSAPETGPPPAKTTKMSTSDPIAGPSISTCYNYDVQDNPVVCIGSDSVSSVQASLDKPFQLTAIGRDMEALNRGGYSCSPCPSLEETHCGAIVSHGIFHIRRPYRCSKCGLHFSGESELQNSPFPKPEDPNAHICHASDLVKTSFSPGNIWKCGHCRARFPSESERHTHEQLCDSFSLQNLEKIDLRHKCLSCSKRFRNLAEWQLHRILEHPQVASISCLFCDEVFFLQTTGGDQVPDVIGINAHFREKHLSFSIHNIKDYCDFCGVIFTKPAHLQSHLEKEHGLAKDTAYSCAICHFRSGHKTSVKAHIVRNHAPRLKQLPQKQAPLPFFPWEPEICDICGYATIRKLELLSEHKLAKHGVAPEDSSEVFRCSEEGCGFRTLLEPLIHKHQMKEHNAERKLVCDVCGKGFLTRTHLSRHEEIHRNKNAGVKPYQCEICGNSFAVQNYLYIHMRLSHQNRPFASTNRKRKPNRNASQLPNQ